MAAVGDFNLLFYPFGRVLLRRVCRPSCVKPLISPRDIFFDLKLDYDLDSSVDKCTIYQGFFRYWDAFSS